MLFKWIIDQFQFMLSVGFGGGGGGNTNSGGNDTLWNTQAEKVKQDRAFTFLFCEDPSPEPPNEA